MQEYKVRQDSRFEGNLLRPTDALKKASNLSYGFIDGFSGTHTILKFHFDTPASPGDYIQWFSKTVDNEIDEHLKDANPDQDLEPGTIHFFEKVVNPLFRHFSINYKTNVFGAEIFTGVVKHLLSKKPIRQILLPDQDREEIYDTLHDAIAKELSDDTTMHRMTIDSLFNDMSKNQNTWQEYPDIFKFYIADNIRKACTNLIDNLELRCGKLKTTNLLENDREFVDGRVEALKEMSNIYVNSCGGDLRELHQFIRTNVFEEEYSQKIYNAIMDMAVHVNQNKGELTQTSDPHLYTEAMDKLINKAIDETSGRTDYESIKDQIHEYRENCYNFTKTVFYIFDKAGIMDAITVNQNMDHNRTVSVLAQS